MIQQLLQQPPSFIQIHFNTGDFRIRYRAEIDTVSIDHVLPIIDADGGAVFANPNVILSICRPVNAHGQRVPGAAYFELASRGAVNAPYLAAMACWNGDLERPTWRRWCDLVRSLGSAYQTLAGFIGAPSAPWLARLDLPGPRPDGGGAIGDIDALLCVIFFGFIESE